MCTSTKINFLLEIINVCKRRFLMSIKKIKKPCAKAESRFHENAFVCTNEQLFSTKTSALFTVSLPQDLGVAEYGAEHLDLPLMPPHVRKVLVARYINIAAHLPKIHAQLLLHLAGRILTRQVHNQPQLAARIVRVLPLEQPLLRLPRPHQPLVQVAQPVHAARDGQDAPAQAAPHNAAHRHQHHVGPGRGHLHALQQHEEIARLVTARRQRKGVQALAVHLCHVQMKSW